MNKFPAFLAATTILALAACSGSADENAAANEAESFAARIGGGNAVAPQPGQGGLAGQPGATPAATYTPPPGVAPGPYVAGTATDPNAACWAFAVAPFLGMPDDEQTRDQIAEALGEKTDVQFVAPGGAFIAPDPASRQLNIMVDTTGVVRDARCGG